MDFARVVLKVRIAQEGTQRIEDGCGGEHLLVVRVERHEWLERQCGKPHDEDRHIEQQQRGRVLLPGLWTGVDTPLEPAQPVPPALSLKGRGRMEAIKDPAHVHAEGYSQ